MDIDNIAYQLGSFCANPFTYWQRKRAESERITQALSEFRSNRVKDATLNAELFKRRNLLLDVNWDEQTFEVSNSRGRVKLGLEDDQLEMARRRVINLVNMGCEPRVAELAIAEENMRRWDQEQAEEAERKRKELEWPIIGS